MNISKLEWLADERQTVRNLNLFSKKQMALKYLLIEDWTTKNCVLTIADRIRLRSLTVEWYSTGHFALYILFNTFFLSSLYYEKPIPTIALYLSKLICFYQDNWGWRNNNIFFSLGPYLVHASVDTSECQARHTLCWRFDELIIGCVARTPVAFKRVI